MAGAPLAADAEAQRAFERVVLRAERTRAGLLAALFGAMAVVIVVLILWAVATGALESGGQAVAGLAFVGGMAAFEGVLWRDAGRRLREGRAPSDLSSYVVVVVEIGAFVAGNAWIGAGGDGALVVLAALVALSAFRMNGGATLLASAAAAAGYLALVATVRPEAMAAEGEAARVVWTAGLYLATGAAIALMARSVREAAVRLATGAVAQQRLQGDLLDSVEATQANVGRALHDGVGSHLTGLSFYTRGLVRRLERGEPVTAAEMEDAAGMVDEAVRQVRQISRGLSPSEIEPGGLAGALADLAANATRAAGVPVVLHADDDLPAAGPGVEGHLYRIAQEAVTNALKHADPSRVLVSLESDEGLVLSVEDDGCGLPDERAEGVGLRSLHHRADLVGGTLVIAPGVEGGTTVRVRVPDAGGGRTLGGRSDAAR